MALSVAADVDICANALRLLGEDPIVSLEDDSERARLCNAFYAPTRDAVLRAHAWNFALRRAALNRLAAAPLFEWQAQFQLPADPFCLRVIRTDNDEYPWKIEGRLLLTNRDSVKILYVARILDVTLYDPLFVDALTYRLAEKMAMPITGSLEKAKAFRELYLQILAEALTYDGQEGTPDVFEADQLIRVR